jgi:salicylate hydroxylase
MSLIDPAIKDGYDTIATGNGWEEKGKIWFDFNLGVEEKGWRDLPPPKEWKEGQWIAGVKAGNVGQNSVHRAHFLDVLIRLIPDGVAKFGKRVESVEWQENRKMKLTFHDGSTAEHDAVIGCDGVKSRTREALLGTNSKELHPQFTGKYAYRGLIPMEKAVAAIGEKLARNSQMYMGRSAHVLTFPIEKGKTMNVVAFQTKKDGKWEDERWVLPMKKEDMFTDFEGWGDSVQHILKVSRSEFETRYLKS